MFKILILVAANLIVISSAAAAGDRSIEHPDWPRNKSTKVLDYVKPYRDTALLKPSAFSEDCKADLAWIFVISATTHFKQRKIIRETWGNMKIFNASAFDWIHGDLSERIKANNDDLDPLKDVKITFLIGKTPIPSVTKRILKEQEMHGDLLQEDFVDTYQNLTLKSLFMLKWANLNQCVHKYKFIIKADDDIFLNLPNLIQILRGGIIPNYDALWRFYNVMYPNRRYQACKALTESERQKLILGEMATPVPPVSDATSKYYTPAYMHPQNYYPPYLNGALYILSQKVTTKLLEQSFTVNLINMEDTYITGILAKKIGVAPMHSNLWSVFKVNDTCAQRGLVFENLEDARMVPKIMSQIFNSSIQCQVYF